MEDNRALESFLSLLDSAEDAILSNALREDVTISEYEVKDKEEIKIEEPAFDISSCHNCSACFERDIYAEPILHKECKILFVAPYPEGNTIFSEASNDYFSKWIDSISLGYSDISLTTLIKCPVREFKREYADKCKGFLRDEMSALKPESIVLLGSEVASYMLRRSGDFDQILRGKSFKINLIPTFCTYCPSSLVANRALRAPIWSDLLYIAASIGLEVKR